MLYPIICCSYNLVSVSEPILILYILPQPDFHPHLLHFFYFVPLLASSVLFIALLVSFDCPLHHPYSAIFTHCLSYLMSNLSVFPSNIICPVNYISSTISNPFCCIEHSEHLCFHHPLSVPQFTSVLPDSIFFTFSLSLCFPLWQKAPSA